jgi:hypothetical protein
MRRGVGPKKSGLSKVLVDFAFATFDLDYQRDVKIPVGSF